MLLTGSILCRKIFETSSNLDSLFNPPIQESCPFLGHFMLTPIVSHYARLLPVLSLQCVQQDRKICQLLLELCLPVGAIELHGSVHF